MVQLMVMFFLLIPTLSLAKGRGMIVVKAHTEITSKKTIHMSDVVEFKTLSKELKQRINKIVLGNAPKEGERRVFSNRVISEIIRKNLGNESKKIQFKIPKNVVVKNRGYKLSRHRVQKQLFEQWRKICRECRFELSDITLPVTPAHLNKTPWVIEGSDQLPNATFTKKIQFFPENAPTAVYWIKGAVKTYRVVPVLRRPMASHARFQPEDFKRVERNVSHHVDAGIPSDKEIIGQQARFNMKANSVIWQNRIVREKAVYREQSVKVIFKTDIWEVSTLAKALQDGYIGDVIRVKNMTSKKMITGVLNKKGEVVVR